MAHDFGGNLQDRLRALLKALGEPIGGLQAIRQKALVGGGAGAAMNDRRVGLVDEQPRQAFRIELDAPRAVGRGAHGHIGHDRLHGFVAEGVARLGIQPLDFREHLLDVLVVDFAEFAQFGEIPLRQQGQIFDKPPHRRIETVALAQLD